MATRRRTNHIDDPTGRHWRHETTEQFRKRIAAKIRAKERRPPRPPIRPVNSTFESAHICEGVFHVGDRAQLGWSLTAAKVGTRLVIGTTGSPRLMPKAARALGHWLVAVAQE